MDAIILPKGAEKFAKMHRTHGDYNATIQKEYKALKEHLPENVESVLDIGCGLGGFDVLLQRHYPDASFHLMDGTGKGSRHAGYAATMQPFNDMSLTEECMKLNGVDAEFYEINPGLNIEVDLIVSFYSWCFHYPANAYMDLVKRSGAHTLIVDVRRGRLEPCWNGVAIEMPKGNRMIYKC